MAREGDTWGPRHIVCDGQAVGTIGPLGPPEDGEVEVGYGLVEAARGRGPRHRGAAGAAAETDAAGVRVRAGVQPDNGASLKLLAGCGFTELRGAMRRVRWCSHVRCPTRPGADGRAAPGRDRPRRHARAHRRHGVAVRPRRHRCPRRAGGPGGVRHRTPPALGRGGLRVRRSARPGGGLERRPGVGRGPRRDPPDPADRPGGRPRGVPPDRGRRCRDRSSRSRPWTGSPWSPTSWSATRSLPAASGARVDQIFDRPAVKVLARHEGIETAGVLGPGHAAVGELAVITWSSTGPCSRSARRV